MAAMAAAAFQVPLETALLVMEDLLMCPVCRMVSEGCPGVRARGRQQDHVLWTATLCLSMHPNQTPRAF